MKLSVSIDDAEIIEEFHRLSDPVRDACEELSEAVVALTHYDRGRASQTELVNELADAIISSVHWSQMTLGVDALNNALAEKMEKAQERIEKMKNGIHS